MKKRKHKKKVIDIFNEVNFVFLLIIEVIYSN